MAPFEPHDDHEHGTTGRDVTLILLVMILTAFVLTTFDPGPRDDDFKAHSAEAQSVEVEP